jgi:hypothetical protein
MNTGQAQAAIGGFLPSFVLCFPNDDGGVVWTALGGVSISATSAALPSAAN